MQVSTRAFHAPKRGNARNEYEDAFFPGRVDRDDLAEFRCAVADGASESAFAGEWARLLARGFARRKLVLRRLHRCWQRLVGRRPVPWYLEEKIRRGAHAALVGLTLRHDPAADATGGSWHVAAVGDSCLFHVRDDRLLAVTPVLRSTDFDNAPRLISTDPTASFGVDESCLVVDVGRWRPHDSFYLATDALAQWALRQQESGKPPWKLLRALGSDDPESEAEDDDRFEAFVSRLRDESGLRNDDTTLLRVEVT